MASQTEKAFGLKERVKSFLNYDLNQDAPGNTPIFDRPEPIENPTAGQAITQAINTVPSMVKSGVEGVAELGKKVYKDPNILIDAAIAAKNIVYNPKDVPFLAAIRSRLLRLTGNFDHVFETNPETGEIENKVKEIEKPLDDFFASKKEQYGENWRETLANNPEAFLGDAANLYGLGAVGKNAISNLIPDKETVLRLTTPEPELVPVTANAGSTPRSLADQTKSLMPTVRKTMAGPGAVDYQGRALEKAEQMRREGASAEEIFDKTGRVATMRGGKKGYGFGDQFKFEINDAGILIDDSTPRKIMEFNGGPSASPYFIHGEAFSVKSLIPNHKELFTQYPRAKNLVVRFLDKAQKAPDGIRPLGANSEAHYDPTSNEIVFQAKILNDFNSPKNRDTFFHELQHALQAEDASKIAKKWVSGGGEASIKSLSDPMNSFTKFHIQNLSSDKKMLKIREELRELGEKFSRDKSEKLANKLAYKWSEFKNKSYEVYLRTGKEIEAATVGRRSELDDQLRKGIGRESRNTLVKDLKRQEKLITKKSYFSNKPDNYIEKIMKRLGPPKKLSPALKGQYLNEAVEFIIEYQGKKTEFESYSDDQIKKIRDQIDAEGFAKGGSTMNKQTEMAFMQQGGLKDDGMNKDPVSGNSVPNGSMANEVRDDIPAQLSEGEYVVPADVVRYYGVKHFEDIRNKAKSGLQSMEANGRIGGEPVPVGGPKAGMQQQQPPTPYNTVPTQPQQQMSGGLNQGEMNEIQSMMMAVGGFVEEPNNMQQRSNDPYQQQQTMYKQPMAMGAANGTDVSGFGFTPGSVNETVVDGSFSTKPTTAIVDKTVTQTSVTLYSPDGLIVKILNLPEQEMEYNNLIAQGYVTTKPTVAQKSSGGSRSGGSGGTPGGGSPAVDKDYGKNVDWSKPDEYANKIYNGLDNMEGAAKTVAGGAVALGAPGLGIVLGIGAKFKIGKGISELSVAAILAKAQGLPTKGIEEKIDNLVKRGGGLLQLGSYLGLMSGQKEATVVLNRDGYQYNKDENGQPNFDDLFTREQMKYNSNLGSTPAPAAPAVVEQPSANNRPSFAQRLREEQQREESKKVTAAQSAAATEGVATAPGRTDTSGKVAGDSGYVSALRQRQIDAGKTQANKGGLMTSKKKKKKTKGK